MSQAELGKQKQIYWESEDCWEQSLSGDQFCSWGQEGALVIAQLKRKWEAKNKGNQMPINQVPGLNGGKNFEACFPIAQL